MAGGKKTKHVKSKGKIHTGWDETKGKNQTEYFKKRLNLSFSRALIVCELLIREAFGSGWKHYFVGKVIFLIGFS